MESSCRIFGIQLRSKTRVYTQGIGKRGGELLQEVRRISDGVVGFIPFPEAAPWAHFATPSQLAGIAV